MRILSHYILKEFLRLFLFCLFLFISLFLIVEYLTRLGDFNQAGVPVGVSFTYIALKIPAVLNQMFPVALLMGIQLTLGLLAKNNQILAIKSSGISMRRSTFPLILFALVLTFSSQVLGEGIIPYTNQKASALWQQYVEKKEATLQLVNEKLWYKGPQAIYNFQLVDGQQGTLHGVSLFFFDQQFNLTRRLDARSAQYQGGRWRFQDGLFQDYQTPQGFHSERFSEKWYPLPETIDDFLKEERPPEEMTFAELREYVRKIREEGYDPTRFLVEMYHKTAFPFVNVFLALMGIALPLRQDRGGSLSWAIAMGLGATFAYWMTAGIMRSLGQFGVIPPIMAAWMPNLLFGLIGTYLLLGIKE
jgi:lipopolysaccharide export system permease protein